MTNPVDPVALRRLVERWKKEAQGYSAGTMFETPVGDMNRASLKVVKQCIHDLDAVLAGSAVPLKEDGWQDIATAPKDADVLLLYLDGSGVLPGYWEDGRWLSCETHDLTGGGWHAEPTHWMPLPSPPVPQTKDETADPSRRRDS